MPPFAVTVMVPLFKLQEAEWAVPVATHGASGCSNYNGSIGHTRVTINHQHIIGARCQTRMDLEGSITVWSRPKIGNRSGAIDTLTVADPLLAPQEVGVPD